MASNILLYPTLTEELQKKIRFQKKPFAFYYEKDEEECELKDEPTEAYSSIYLIKDEAGIWSQDEYNLCFRRQYCLRTFQCLFGELGIACHSAKLGIAIIWTSSDSKQRGVIPVGTFCEHDSILEATAEQKYHKAQLRGEVNFSTILYIAEAGIPSEDERHLANENGYILGELDNYTIKLDGSGSAFPVFEVYEEGQPLWYVKCDWMDPTMDLFEDCVSINLNTAHKNYKYIDQKQKVFNSQLLAEIMASALTIIIEKLRLDPGYWEQITINDSLEHGSVGQAIYYFMDTLQWDLSTPESVSLCARKFFDQRM